MTGCDGCIYYAAKAMRQVGIGCDYTAWTGRTRTAQLTKKELKKKPCPLYESWEDKDVEG